MNSQVVFYGRVQKARMLLACVQAAILDCRGSRRSPATTAILERYASELEEIEADIVSLINAARAPEDSGDIGPGSDDEPSSGRDVL